MKGIKFHQNLGKFILRRIRLNSKFSLVEYRDNWEKPEIRMPNQVIVKTRFTGICGSDIHQIKSHISNFSSVLVSPEMKYLPLGHEIVGEVIECGPKVKKLKKGDRVIVNPLAHCKTIGLELCAGCMAGDWQYCKTLVENIEIPINGNKEHTKIDVSDEIRGFGVEGFCDYFLAFEGQLYIIPSAIPDHIAVLAEPLAVALHAVYRNPPNEDDIVMVNGSGTIGLMLILALRILNPECHVIATAKYPFQSNLAKLLGAQNVIQSYTGNSKKDWAKTLTNLNSITFSRWVKPVIGKLANFSACGVSIIYDSIGSEQSIDFGLHILRNGGKIIVTGLGITKSKTIDWSLAIYKEIQINGTFLYGLSHNNEANNSQLIDPFQKAVEILDENQEKLGDLVTHKFQITNYKEAFKVAMSKSKYRAIKPAIEWNNS